MQSEIQQSEAQKPEKRFNNLRDSIIATVLFGLCLLFYIVVMIGIAISPGENRVFGFIITSVLFGLGTISLGCIVFFMGFSYWYMDDTGVWGQKLFRPLVCIPYDQIEEIELVHMGALKLWSCSTNACILSNGENTVTVFYETEFPRDLYRRIRPYVQDKIAQKAAETKQAAVMIQRDILSQEELPSQPEEQPIQDAAEAPPAPEAGPDTNEIPAGATTDQ